MSCLILHKPPIILLVGAGPTSSSVIQVAANHVVALVTAVVPGLLCGVAVALVPALRTTIARMGKPLARLAALLCMYWLTGT